MTNTSMKRRDFLKTSTVAAGTGAFVKQTMFPSQAAGANDRMRVGVIGTGRMGLNNMRDFMKIPGVEIAAVCDVYEPHLKKGLDMTEGKADSYSDFRRIIDRKDIDIVINSTPDHWHALPTIMACEAGKDVYVEKPISHNIEEGILMVKAARYYDRVVQVGTQQRSGEHFQRAVELVRGGKLGPIGLVRCWNYGNEYPEGIDNPPDSEPLPGLDWDMWLGPAPMVQFNINRFTKVDGWATFRYFWDYAGGKLTDWGTHLIDIVHWAMDVDAPKSIRAMGGKYYLRDNRETPNIIDVTYEYPGFICAYHYCGLNAHGGDGHSYGIQFYGTQGTLFVDRGGYRIYPEEEKIGPETISKMESIRSGTSEQHFAHVQNFFDCVHSRQRPISDIEIGHRSSAATLLACIADRSNEVLEWDGIKEKFSNKPELNSWLSRKYRAPWDTPYNTYKKKFLG